MGGCNANNTPNITQQESSNRSKVFLLISSFKGKNSNFHRQTQFIAFSIIDRLHQENYFMDEGLKLKKASNQRLAASSILLASKFNDVHPIKMETILSFFTNKTMTSQEILQTQSEILECINFIIPYETAYSSLSKRINMENTRETSCSPNLLKSMKLLMVSIKEYPVLVLDPKLGDEIYDVIWNKRVSKRIAQIYKNIRQKEGQNQNCSTKINSSIRSEVSAKA